MPHYPHGKLDSVFFVFCVSLVVREIIRPGIPIPMYCLSIYALMLSLFVFGLRAHLPYHRSYGARRVSVLLFELIDYCS